MESACISCGLNVFLVYVTWCRNTFFADDQFTLMSLRWVLSQCNSDLIKWENVKAKTGMHTGRMPRGDKGSEWYICIPKDCQRLPENHQKLQERPEYILLHRPQKELTLSTLWSWPRHFYHLDQPVYDTVLLNSPIKPIQHMTPQF